MKERIKAVRMSQIPKLSQEAFGKRIGVTGAAISRIESGDRSVTDQIIKSICHEFDVSEQWLRTGEGEMNVPRTRDEEIADFVADVMTAEPDDIRVRMIAVMSRLTAEDWAFIAKRARELKEELDKAENEKTGP